MSQARRGEAIKGRRAVSRIQVVAEINNEINGTPPFDIAPNQTGTGTETIENQSTSYLIIKYVALINQKNMAKI